MKVSLLFSLICFQSILFSQNSINYFNYVTQAEVALCDSNWSKALSFYDEAIANRGNNSFAFDVHNAIVCSILLDKYDKACDLSKRLIEKGCTFDYFNKPLFTKLKESKEWREFVKDSSILKVKSEKLRTNPISKLIDSLSCLDQNKEIKNRKQLFFDNAFILKGIIDSIGYPSENIVGVHVEHDRFFIDKPTIMFHHFFSYNKDSSDFTSLLYKKVLAGEYHPAQFAWLTMTFKDKKYQYSRVGNNAITIVNDTLYIYNPNTEQLAEYNKNRKEINLPDLESFIKITLFFRRDKRFTHPIDGRITIIDFSDENSKKDYLKDYKKYVK